MGWRGACAGDSSTQAHAPFLLALPGQPAGTLVIPRLTGLNSEAAGAESCTCQPVRAIWTRATREISATCCLAEPPWRRTCRCMKLAKERIGPVFSPTLCRGGGVCLDQPATSWRVMAPCCYAFVSSLPDLGQGQRGLVSGKIANQGQGFEHLYICWKAALAGLRLWLSRRSRLVADDIAAAPACRLGLWSRPSHCLNINGQAPGSSGASPARLAELVA